MISVQSTLQEILQKAVKLFLEHLELMDAMFMDVNPIVIKEAPI